MNKQETKMIAETQAQLHKMMFADEKKFYTEEKENWEAEQEGKDLKDEHN